MPGGLVACAGGATVGAFAGPDPKAGNQTRKSADVPHPSYRRRLKTSQGNGDVETDLRLMAQSLRHPGPGMQASSPGPGLLQGQIAAAPCCRIRPSTPQDAHRRHVGHLRARSVQRCLVRGQRQRWHLHPAARPRRREPRPVRLWCQPRWHQGQGSGRDRQGRHQGRRVRQRHLPEGLTQTPGPSPFMGGTRYHVAPLRLTQSGRRFRRRGACAWTHPGPTMHAGRVEHTPDPTHRGLTLVTRFG